MEIDFKSLESLDQGLQSKHFIDLIALTTIKELEQAKKWCVGHDVSEIFDYSGL